MQESVGRAVLFDFDDTLVRTRECKYRAIRALAERHYGVSMSNATIDASWGLPYDVLFTRLFGEFDADLARVIGRYEALNDEFPVVATKTRSRRSRRCSRARSRWGW